MGPGLTKLEKIGTCDRVDVAVDVLQHVSHFKNCEIFFHVFLYNILFFTINDASITI